MLSVDTPDGDSNGPDPGIVFDCSAQEKDSLYMPYQQLYFKVLALSKLRLNNIRVFFWQTKPSVQYVYVVKKARPCVDFVNASGCELWTGWHPRRVNKWSAGVTDDTLAEGVVCVGARRVGKLRRALLY